MSFSTGTRLECVDSTGPELGLLLGRFAGSERWTPLQKQKRKRISGGSPVAAPMPKPVLSCGREYQLLRERMFLRTFHRWGDLVFIAYVFPNWMVVRILSHWMGDFLPLSISD